MVVSAVVVGDPPYDAFQIIRLPLMSNVRTFRKSKVNGRRSYHMILCFAVTCILALKTHHIALTLSASQNFEE